MSEQIKAALAKLDVNNDAHWTADGLPRLDTVKFLAGNQAVTREDVSAAAPGFSRANAIVGTEQNGAQATQAVQGNTTPAPLDNVQPAAATQAPALLNGDSNGEVDSQATEGEDEVEVDEVAKLEKELAFAQEKLAEIKQYKVRVDNAHADAIAEVDKAIQALEQVRGKEAPGDAIRGYLERQRLDLAERAERQRKLKESGVDLRAVAASVMGAPIDQAMARRTSRGINRPTRG